MRDLLSSGADKVAVNTAAVNNPKLITEISNKFGSQAMVISIEAKKKVNNKWEVYTECGRVPTGIDVIEWAKKAERLGAGEILLTSIDYEGTRKGFDCNLYNSVSSEVSIPIIASGGYGNLKHIDPILKAGSDAIAIAGCLHYSVITVEEIKEQILLSGFTSSSH